MAAAFDSRVKAIMPGCADPNVKGFIRDVLPDSGKPPLSTAEYARRHPLARQDNKSSKKLFEVIDPLNYIDKLRMPKLFMSAGNDDFTHPDSLGGWWSKLPEPKSHVMLPNLPHLGQMTPWDFLPAAVAFAKGVMMDRKMPEITWDISNSSGAITMRQASSHAPRRVTLWSAS